MKKIKLFVLLIANIVVTAGCSCNKEIYKFDCIIFDGKTYTCSNSDKKDSGIKVMCDNMTVMKIELKDDDTMIVNMPSYNMNNEEAEYKIEGNYLYMKDSGEWMRFAKYTGDRLEIEMTGIKVVLKK